MTAMHRASTLDIVIVNWNAGTQLRACLESVARTRGENVALNRVVVVDNASADGSADGLGDIALPLEILRNPVNRGFGAACNQGARGSDADYLLFLNPDMRLPDDALSVPVAWMERAENSEVGVCGIQLVGDDGAISRTCAVFPTPARFASKMLGLDRLAPSRFPSHFMDDWPHDQTRAVDHVIGAFYLIRRPLFDRLRGFDERFFVYLEDLDLSRRVADAGFRSVFLTDARAFHKGGGTSEQIKATRLFYSLRSRVQYGFKHFAPLPATLLLFGTLLIEPWPRLALALAHRSGREAIDTLRGIGRLWTSLPTLIASRS